MLKSIQIKWFLTLAGPPKLEIHDFSKFSPPAGPYKRAIGIKQKNAARRALQKLQTVIFQNGFVSCHLASWPWHVLLFWGPDRNRFLGVSSTTSTVSTAHCFNSLLVVSQESTSHYENKVVLLGIRDVSLRFVSFRLVYLPIHIRFVSFSSWIVSFRYVFYTNRMKHLEY